MVQPTEWLPRIMDEAIELLKQVSDAWTEDIRALCEKGPHLLPSGMGSAQRQLVGKRRSGPSTSRQPFLQAHRASVGAVA